MKKESKVQTKRIQLTIPTESIESLDKVAQTMGVTKSALVTMLIRKYLKRLEAKD